MINDIYGTCHHKGTNGDISLMCEKTAREAKKSIKNNRTRSNNINFINFNSNNNISSNKEKFRVMIIDGCHRQTT